MANIPQPPDSEPPSGTTSAELLRRVGAGDNDALNGIFVRYVPQLLRWAHRRLPGWARNAADTHDIVQDTVLHTIRNLPTFVPQRDGALLGYMRRALLNRVRDHLRNATRHPGAREVEDVLPHLGASPLEITIERDDRRRYRIALLGLRSSDRTAIIGRIELGYSYEQLALMLAKPTPGAARLAVRRALLRLADEMRRG